MIPSGWKQNSDGSMSPPDISSTPALPSMPTSPMGSQQNTPQNPMSPWVNSFNRTTGLQDNWADVQGVGTKRADGKIKRKNGMWMTDEEMNAANGVNLGSGILSSLGQTNSKFGMIS